MTLPDPKDTMSIMVKLEVIKRLFWLIVIAFVTIRFLGHVDHWVETIWRHP